MGKDPEIGEFFGAAKVNKKMASKEQSF